jgi:hypothetical protein
MALQIRRGLETDRAVVTPAPGELLFTTDQSKLYIGDGATAGGTLITGSGIGNLVEDITPQLGGDLDINGYKIVSSGNGNIELDPAGTGTIILHGNLTIDTNGNFTKTGNLNFSPVGLTTIGSNVSLVDGNLALTRNSYSSTTGQGFTFSQHHETADAVNFTFYRTRGVGSAPTTVVNGDDIIDINFIGQTTLQAAVAASIGVTVDGIPSTTRVPGKITFATDNGSSQAIRAELSAVGVWKVNSIQNLSGTDLTLTATTVNVAGNMQINAQGDLRFADTDSSNWVAFQAPGTVAANVTWTLPAADGTSGQVLSTDGLGALSWATASGGTGLASRTAVSETTGVLATGETTGVSITGAKGYILYKIQTSVAAWVRIYTSVDARTNDSSRAEGVDPLPGAGVIAEVITTGASTIVMSPGVIGFNDESITSSSIALAVTNKSGSSSLVTVTLTILQIEA